MPLPRVFPIGSQLGSYFANASYNAGWSAEQMGKPPML